MKGSIIIFISFLLLLSAGLIFYKYFINIYETTVSVEPAELYADNQSLATVSVVPLNSLGWKALFRTSPAEFEIIEGGSLAEIVFMDSGKGKLILKAKSVTGRIVINIISEYSLLPMRVEVPVHHNYL